MELSPNKGNKMLDFLKKEIDGKSSQRAYKTLFENLQKIDYINTKKSYGEKIIEKFLRENNISYKTQFDTIHCYNPETRAILPYDFEIPIYKIIIEVQGNQHYKYTPYFHESEEEFHKLQERDQYKKDFAINHGYTFIELDYKSIMNEDYINVLQKIIKEKNKKIYEIEDQER
jgi:very-short-patch-repair endonuclease